MEMKKIHNITVMRLTGTRKERALAHGKYIAGLSGMQKQALVFTPLSQKNQSLIKRATANVPAMGKMMSKLYEGFVLGHFLRLPRRYRARIEPFAKASRIPLKTLWLSLYQPDFLMLLASTAGERLQNRFIEGMPGCSTLTIHDKDAHYFLRNLDYPAAGYWEKNPAVYYHEPSEPELQKYISVGSVGIHTAGLTGWNESGIAFSLHAHFSKKISLQGVPIFFLGEEIMERARTLDEAIQICKNFKTIGSWALNITSFNEKKSVVLELSNQTVSVRDATQDFLAHANDFQTEAFQLNALHFSGGVIEDSESRRRSLEKSAEALTKHFTWAEGLAALANHTEVNTGKTRIFGNIVSAVTSIQSVGFDPKEKCLYVTNRNETPSTHGPYVKLPLNFSEIEKFDTTTLLHIPERYSEDFMKALHLYYQAYVSWQVNNENADVALSLLIQATEILPDDPHLLMQRGYFELMHLEGARAYECFDHALKQDLSENLYQVALYFRAASLDLQGQHEKAIKDYQTILAFKKVDSKLARKTKKRLNKPFKKAYCKKISPDLQFAEPIEYP